MKKGIHPQLQKVVYQDTSNGATFLTLSTAKSEETIKWEDGQEYPLLRVEISSASHPFFTGQHRVVDTQGRVEKFMKKYAKSTTKKDKK
ncbi:MAG: type B 50S ribosomal protein L31 [Deltaproteobacteria bacterium]|nr:type B 50S ribosomal protein L31 [Deltaproteobacteria bacterium]